MPEQTPVELRKLELAVDQFAAAMKLQLLRKFTEGWAGWDNPEFVDSDAAIERLLECASRNGPPRKDMVNVANFAMFIWHRYANK